MIPDNIIIILRFYKCDCLFLYLLNAFVSIDNYDCVNYFII